MLTGRGLTVRVLASALAAHAAARGGERPAGEEKPPASVLVLERTVTEYGLKPLEPGEEPPARREVTKLGERRYTVKIGKNRVRESCADTGQITIVRLDRDLVWMMDPGERTYREISLAEIDSHAARSRARLKRRLPLVTDPEQAARLEKLLGAGGKPAKVTVERPGRTRKILGEQCRLTVVKLGGEELFRAWMSDRPVPLAGSRWLRLGGCFSARAADALAAVSGLVMEAVFPMPDGGRLEITTRRVSEAPPAPGDFAHPEELNYKPADRTARSRSKPAETGNK
jgi:hypothetical protein